MTSNMSQGFHGFSSGYNNRRKRLGRQTTTHIHPQWEMVHGKVVSYKHPMDVFRGDEILEVSVVDASLMDAPSVLLGRQKIPLRPGQQFPIRFQFYYDKSRAGPSYNGRAMQASIKNSYDQLIYVNDTSTPLKYNVKIDVIRV